MFEGLMKTMAAKGMLPKISDTERQALEAGSVWIDGDFFAGNPNFDKILRENYNLLSDEERAFLDGPCVELANMIDRYEIQTTRVIPDEVMNFIREAGFMGMLIPKKYGGLEFSALAISTVMAKFSAYCSIVGTIIVIPNSLGAAELIKHYGTDKQKDHYLPKLAKGEYLPCFGLTEPTAGSDAASIKAEGVVFKDGDSVKIKLNFRKRYITLAPVANLISLACVLKDPDNLLGKGEEPGITVALVHKGTPGLHIGDHHVPIGEAFYNGPIVGEDVIIDADEIIGGPEYAGGGWKMLMEQLAGGRAVSLPAGAVGGIRAAAAATGPYSMIRQQFGIPIGHMEGIEDKVGKLAAMAYASEGARVFACSALDAGHEPPVVSAVLKAYTTEMARECGTDGMDVFSGAGVMQGPNNILGQGYCSAPVGITVEGANIMTRTLIIFGQGATRCHPYALNVVKGVEEKDVGKFRSNLMGWIGHFVVNIGRTLIRTLTRGWSFGSPVKGETATYYRRLGWASARFAVLTDLAMFTIGANLKARGNLTGRYADALAWMLIATSTLRRFEAEGRRSEDLPLVRYACDYSLTQVQRAFEDIYGNFDFPVLGFLMRAIGRPLLRINPLGSMPTDDTTRACARAIQSPGEQFHRIIGDVVEPSEDTPGAGRLIHAFRLVSEAAPIVAKISRAQRKRELPRGVPEEFAHEAAEKGIISETEAQQVENAYKARLEAIEVDIFTKEQFFGEQAQDLPQAVNA